MSTTILAPIVLCVLGIIFGIILAVWLSKQITKPIQELTDLSKRMADLDFEAKYTRGGNDEIAQLDEDFHKNLMLATDNSFWITIMDAVIGVYREWINKVLEKSDAEDYKKLLKSHSLIFSGLVENKRDLCMYAIDMHYDIIDRLLKNDSQ